MSEAEPNPTHDALRAGRCPSCDAWFVAPLVDEDTVLLCPVCGGETRAGAAQLRDLPVATVQIVEEPPAAEDQPVVEQPAVEEPLATQEVATHEPPTESGPESTQPLSEPTPTPLASPIVEATDAPIVPNLGVLLSGMQPPTSIAPLAEPNPEIAETPRRDTAAPEETSSDDAAPPIEEQPDPAAPVASVADEATEETAAEPMAWSGESLERAPAPANDEEESEADGGVALDEATAPEPVFAMPKADAAKAAPLEEVAASDPDEAPLFAAQPGSVALLNAGPGDAEDPPWAPPVLSEASAKPRRRVAPYAIAASLVLVALPAAGYLLWPGEPSAARADLKRALANRQGRAALLATGSDEAINDPSKAAAPLADPLFAPRVSAARLAALDDRRAKADEAAPEQPAPTALASATVEGDPSDGPSDGVEQASYETTDYQPNAATVGDRYATAAEAPAEPDPIAPVEEAAPAPAVESGPTLIGAPAYGPEKLSEAMRFAEGAGRAFGAGDLADPEQAGAMGQHYARLCYLAQVLTLYDPSTSTTAFRNEELEASDVYRQLFRSAEARENTRRIASHWIEWTGRPYGGVFFAATPSLAGRAGEVYEYRFPVDGVDIYVVSEEQIDPKRFALAGADEIGVIGIVVEDPATHIRGYGGNQPRVIWARKTLPLRAAQ